MIFKDPIYPNTWGLTTLVFLYQTVLYLPRAVNKGHSSKPRARGRAKACVPHPKESKGPRHRRRSLRSLRFMIFATEDTYLLLLSRLRSKIVLRPRDRKLCVLESFENEEHATFLF